MKAIGNSSPPSSLCVSTAASESSDAKVNRIKSLSKSGLFRVQGRCMCDNILDFAESILFNLGPFELCILLHHLLQWLDNLSEIRHKYSHEIYGSHKWLHPLFIMGQGDLFNGLDSFWIYRNSFLWNYVTQQLAFRDNEHTLFRIEWDAIFSTAFENFP